MIAPFRRFWAEVCAWVDRQEGRPQLTYLRSKDGSIPYVRLPNGQVRSMKRLAQRAREIARRETAAVMAAQKNTQPVAKP